jgi:hypothetical protein
MLWLLIHREGSRSRKNSFNRAISSHAFIGELILSAAGKEFSQCTGPELS